MSDELNLENLDAVPAEEPVVEASEAAADEAAAPVEPVADLSAESDASVDNADVESDAPAATESAPVASTQTETVSLDEDEEEVNESEQAEETDAGQQAVDEFSKSLRSLDGKWYVLHTYSGYENKVKANIEKTIENRKLQDQIFEVRVPLQDVVEMKGGVKKNVSKKMFPGYVLVNMVMNDDTWYVVRNTRGVTGFVGPGSDPVPLSEAEMRNLGIVAQSDNEVEIHIEIGDLVEVTSGAWEGRVSTVTAINMNKQTVTIEVDMFGRETSVEIGFLDVKKL